MSKTRWYRETIEALGMLGNRNPIRNKLNKAMAHSDDPQLRRHIAKALQELDVCSTNTDHTPVRKMKSVKTDELERYCHRRAYPAM